jgi:hypothetical protein
MRKKPNLPRGYPEVNDSGIKLDCLKVRSRLAPSSQILYWVIEYS